jgi:hypothetical protein
MSRQGPKFNLTDVKRLAQDYLDGKKASDGRGSIRFNAPTRSTEVVVKVLFCRPDIANRLIAIGLLALEAKDFFSRKMQWNEVYDEFGLEDYEGHNWYIKYCIVSDDGTEYVEEVSFHPLEKEMVLPNGKTLRVTYDPSDEKG